MNDAMTIVGIFQAASAPLLTIMVVIGYKGLKIIHGIDLRLTRVETKLDGL